MTTKVASASTDLHQLGIPQISNRDPRASPGYLPTSRFGTKGTARRKVGVHIVVGQREIYSPQSPSVSHSR